MASPARTPAARRISLPLHSLSPSVSPSLSADGVQPPPERSPRHRRPPVTGSPSPRPFPGTFSLSRTIPYFNTHTTSHPPSFLVKKCRAQVQPPLGSSGGSSARRRRPRSSSDGCTVTAACVAAAGAARCSCVRVAAAGAVTCSCVRVAARQRKQRRLPPSDGNSSRAAPGGSNGVFRAARCFSLFP